MRILLQTLNWRLMLVHFIAMLLFMYVFKSIAILYDYNFYDFLKANYSKDHIEKFLTVLGKAYPDRVADRLSGDSLRMFYLNALGLLCAFLISLAITIRMRWSWPNSLIAFVAASVVCRYYFSIPVYLSPVFYISYLPLKLHSIWGLVIAAVIAQILGLLLFFSNRMIRFIDKISFRKNVVSAI